MATSWETITAGSTVVKADQVLQLKNALNAERQRRSLATFSLPAPEPAAPTSSGAVIIDDGHIKTIRDNITDFTSFSPGEAINQGVTTVKKARIDELRAKINALENHPKAGGTSDCNASCTGLCVGCVGTCQGGCNTGCTGCSGSCTGGCSGCSGGCSGCSGTCSGGCSGTCSGTCSGGCSICTGCTGCSGCGSGCSGSCSGGCLGCSGTCSALCAGGCSGCGTF